MKISKQARRDARELLRSCRVDHRLDPGRVRRVVAEVLAAKPRSYLAVLSHFQRLVKLDTERYSAVVESAVALGADQQNRVKTLLEQRYGGQLHFTFAVNPALIGGARIRVGSDVYDGSVSGRLEALWSGFEAK